VQQGREQQEAKENVCNDEHNRFGSPTALRGKSLVMTLRLSQRQGPIDPVSCATEDGFLWPPTSPDLFPKYVHLSVEVTCYSFQL
jgi:hypothetical protein